MKSETPTRELRYCWASRSLEVLVPKKRGEGFLSVPLGHHFNKGLKLIEDKLKCDICGLDGVLDIDCGIEIACYEETRKQFTEKAMKLLSEHYGVPYREIARGEMYDILQRKQ